MDALLEVEGIRISSANLYKAIFIGIDRDLFIGTNLYKPTRGRGAYGGHIVAHLVKVALMSLEDDCDFMISSLHCCFISPVKPEKVIYYINSRKDGRTVCFRSVQAIQNGKVACQCLLSFQPKHTRKENLFHIKDPMPLVPSPNHELCVDVSKRSPHFTKGIIDVRVIMPPNWETLIKQTPLPSSEPRYIVIGIEVLFLKGFSFGLNSASL